MKTFDLSVASRTEIGKAANTKMRREGEIPGVLYHNSEVTHLTVNVKALHNAVYTRENYILNLAIDGAAPVQAVLREVQYHPVTEFPLHVDFLQIDDNKAVILELPVKLVGTPEGVIKGGKLVTKLRRIKVKGIPKDLPEVVEVNVGHLDLGGTVKVGEAGITGLQIITSPSAGVASVEIPRALRSAAASKDDGKKKK